MSSGQWPGTPGDNLLKSPAAKVREQTPTKPNFSFSWVDFTPFLTPLKLLGVGDIPGGPVVRTLFSHCQGLVFDP